jgi:hypothetical protein
MFERKKKVYQELPHWSTYKFEPSDRLGRLCRLRKTSSAQDLRNLIIYNPHLKYCFLCGSPSHSIEQCNPNHIGHLKHFKNNKDNDGSTSRSAFDGLRRWSIDVNTLSMSPLSMSNIDVNNGTSFKKSLKLIKQDDTSLLQATLPLIENDTKKKSIIINGEVKRKTKKIYQLKFQGEMKEHSRN